MKVRNLYGQTLTVLSITDHFVRTLEYPNDYIHAANLFTMEGSSLMETLNG